MANNTEMRYMEKRPAYKPSGYWTITLDNNLGLTNATANYNPKRNSRT